MEDCGICYTSFSECSEVKTLSCNHQLCPHCYLRLQTQKCPYCRQISDHLLPYIPCEKGVAKIYGVNSPKTMCMKHKTCEWRFKTGNRRGILCQHDGFETEYGTMCEQHWKKAQMKYSKQKNGLSEQIEWTKEMEDLFQRNTVISLKNKLRENKQKVSGSKKELVIRLISNK